MLTPIEWKDGSVHMLDQRALPEREITIVHTDCEQVADSIRDMVIRGAPAIGVAAAMGIALGVAAGRGATESAFNQLVSLMASTRPTAVNLFWALSRMRAVYQAHSGDTSDLKTRMVEEALAIQREDIETNQTIGRIGQQLLESGQCVLTHCNAGALATAGYGTALGVIRAAVDQGKRLTVMAGETRPYLQGARLTVWELQKEGIPVTLITDNASGIFMAQGKVDAVIVGADRIARNGDTANKIGTFPLAVLADHHGIPFYVVAPLSTFDTALASGEDIPIEERGRDEVLRIRDRLIAPPDTVVRNPAFDVTPAALISAIVTEAGILRRDYAREIERLLPVR